MFINILLNISSVQPDDIGAHINVGRTYNNLNLSDEAEAAYRKAMALFPPVKTGQFTFLYFMYLYMFQGVLAFLSYNVQYNLSTPAKHGTDINGRISQDPEYRRLYHLPQKHT